MARRKDFIGQLLDLLGLQRKPKRKGPAPENKNRGRAPENKGALGREE